MEGLGGLSADRHLAALYMHDGKYGHAITDHAAAVTGTSGVFEEQRTSRTKMVPLPVTGLELHLPRQKAHMCSGEGCRSPTPPLGKCKSP